MSKNSNFQKEMTQVFVSATLADVFTRAVVNGVSGSTEKLDFGDAFLSGAQTGTCFIAYPIAEKLLQKSSTYREKSKHGKGVFTYASTAAVTAAIIASVNYPISKVQELRKKGETVLSVSEFAKLFADQIMPNIGPSLINTRQWCMRLLGEDATVCFVPSVVPNPPKKEPEKKEDEPKHFLFDIRELLNRK